MPREAFARRVWSLRDSWVERRNLNAVGQDHTLDSQFGLLLQLHEWTCESADDIRTVYGPRFDIVVGPPPARDQSPPAFSVTIAGSHNLTVALTQRRKSDDAPWYVHMNVEERSPGPVDIRASNSARGRLQDALLTVLGAYERSRMP